MGWQASIEICCSFLAILGAIEAAQSIRTGDNVAHSQVNHHPLLLGNWNILSLTGKELELVEEAKRYHLDIIGVSSTKRRGSGTVDLDRGWKLFYSDADRSMSTQAGVGILTSPRLSDCASDWIPLESRVCMLKLKVLNRSLCLLQVQVYNNNNNCNLYPPWDNTNKCQCIWLRGQSNIQIALQNKIKTQQRY